MLSPSEASHETNPAGEFMYGAWAQWQHDDVSGDITGRDAMARLVCWIDDFIPDNAWTLSGSSGGSITWLQALK